MPTGFFAVPELLEHKAEQHKHSPFLFYRDSSISYEELNSMVTKAASGLLAEGVRKGDKVGILSHNSIDYVILEFAILKIGAVCVPLNRHFKGDLLAYVINHSDLSSLFIESQYVNNVKDVLPKLGVLTFVVREGEEARLPNAIVYESLVNRDVAGPLRVSATYEDPAFILYTSGTTGLPKGVIYEHYGIVPQNFETYSQAQLEAAGYSFGDVLYLPFPLYHVFGQVQLIGALRNDCKVALADRFSASNFWHDVVKYKATVILHQGVSIPILLRQPPSDLDRQHNARISLGAGVPNERVWREFEDRFGVKILEYYASTEGAFFGCGTVPTNKVGTIGKAYGFAELRIVDEYGKDAGVNRPGRLLSRLKPEYSRKKPEQLYYKDPAAGLKRFTHDGWFISGDIVYMDEEGYLHYVGREETRIRYRGENVSPEQVENIINMYPAVLESVVVGVYNEEFGDEDIKAFIVAKNTREFDHVEFIRWCEQRMPYFMIPRYIELLDEPIRKNEDTGKPLRAYYKSIDLTDKTWDRLRSAVKLSRETS
ncbi:MAG: AMP-binding protein [Candidatus Caldarchaeum sp.]